MSDPDYAISIQPGYVLVENPPDYDVVWIEQQPKLKAISAACSEADSNKVLMRGSKTNVKLTERQIFILGEEVGKLKLKIAVVELHDASKKDAEFLETIATNRGSPLRFFNKEQDAKDWLGV